MQIIPALDLRGGSVVRLRQGDYTRETTYDIDPLARSQQYAAQGAKLLHLVDLDAARSGEFVHLEIVSEIAKKTSLTVQAGGGVRESTHVKTLLNAGVDRVVVGSVAVRSPDLVVAWLNEFGAEKLCIALDARVDEHGVWHLPHSGWTADSGAELFSLLQKFADAGAVHFLCTDISRDGELSGPNIELYAELVRRFANIQLQASGGMRGTEDIPALRKTGVSGVIVGRSLVEDRVTLPELLAC